MQERMATIEDEPNASIEIPRSNDIPPPTPGVRFDDKKNTYQEAEEGIDETEELIKEQKKMEMKYPQSQFSVPGVNSSRVCKIACFICWSFCKA